MPTAVLRIRLRIWLLDWCISAAASVLILSPFARLLRYQERHTSLTFSLCRLACAQSPSPSACLCLPFSIFPLFSLYSGRNVRYVDQRTGRMIFQLSFRERAKQERGGEKQPPLPPRLMHPSSPLSARSNNPSHTSAAQNLLPPHHLTPMQALSGPYLTRSLQQGHWLH